MTEQLLLAEPIRVAEPDSPHPFAKVLAQVASDGQPVIVCRNGEDLAAVVSLAHLDILREALAQQEVERLASQIDWEQARKTMRPAQKWFEGDEPKPF